MSAFVVSHATMNQAVAGIIASRGDRWNKAEPFTMLGAKVDPADRETLTALGRRLLAMNTEAVSQRYNDPNPENLPGTIGETAEGFTYRGNGQPPTTANKADQLKQIRCLIYQCAEGEVYGSPGYEELEAAAGNLAQVIAGGLPEYQRASWGG